MRLKLFKRVSAVLLTLVVLGGLMPLNVSAAAPTTVYVNGENIVTAEDNTVACGTGTAVYNSATNTLTLIDAEITAAYNSSGIYADGDLMIVLEGENTISSLWAGIRVQNGSVSISGEGSLNVADASAFGIVADNNVSIGADVNKLVVFSAVQALRSEKGGSVTIGEKVFSGLDSKITIENGVVVFPISELTVNGVDILTAPDNTVSCGGGKAIYDPSSNTLTLDNVQIVYQQYENDNTQGSIQFDGDLNINLIGENSITSACGGIYSKNGGTLTITGDKLTVDSVYYGIAKLSGGNVTIDGAKLDIDVEKKTPFSSNGLKAEGTLSILNGAYVEAIGEIDTPCVGNNSVVISDSTVYAHAESTAGDSAIVSDGNISISNSTVDAKSCNAYGSPTIIAGNDLMGSNGDISISDNSMVTIYSDKGNAAYTMLGNIVIRDSEVKADAYSVALVSTNDITISNSTVYAGSEKSWGIWAMKDLLLEGTPDVTSIGGIDGDDSFILIPADGQLIDVWIGDSEDNASRYGDAPLSEKTSITKNGRYFHSKLHIHTFDQQVASDYYKASDATCTESAFYYKSCICGETGTETFKDGAPNGHVLTKTEAKDPTCTEKGNTAYWTCANCHKYFSDENGVAEISLSDTVIEEIGHRFEGGSCTVCGTVDAEFKPVITAGANGVWQKGSKEGLSFTSNAAFDTFLEVQVDGKNIDAVNYEVREGSTIVTLKTSYLETLSVGKHTLGIVSDTGTAVTEFTIKAASAVQGDKQSPQTGDSGNTALWIFLMLAAGASAAGTVVYNRKKKYSR